MADGGMIGKICMVTGATSGIGLVTARELARLGARVILVARSAAKGAQATDQIQLATGNPAVEFMQADLSALAQVRGLAADFCRRYDRLDVLVNNAGGFFMKRQVSADGIEMTWALNYLSVFLLTNLLLDPLKTAASAGVAAAAPSRIVNVSSETQRSARLDFDDLERRARYSGIAAYAQAKLAVILFTYELARRLAGTGVTANALHPGFVATNIYANSGGIVKLFAPLIHLFAVTPYQGAENSVYLASSPEVAAVSGKYFVGKSPAPSNKISYDEAAGQRLWKLSAEQTGLAL